MLNSVLLAVTLTIPWLSWDTTHMENEVINALDTARSDLLIDPTSAASWGLMAMTLEAHGITELSFQCYEKAAQLDSVDYRWPYLAARTSSTRPDRASVFYAQAADLAPKDHAFLIDLGHFHSKLHQWNRARRAFNRALVLVPESSHAYLGLARISWVIGNPIGALDFLDQALEKNQENNEIYRLLAQVHQNLGDQVAAQRARELTTIFPNRKIPSNPLVESIQHYNVSREGLQNRIRHYLLDGNLWNARVTLGKLRERGFSTATDWTICAEFYSNNKDFHNARRCAAESHRLYPESPTAQLSLARIVLTQDPLSPLGHELLQKVLNNSPTQKIEKNVAAFRAQLDPTRVDLLEAALESNPSNLNLYPKLANAASQKGNHPLASRTWETLKNIRPLNSQEVAHSATELIRMGLFEKARARLENHQEVIRNKALYSWILISSPNETDGAVQVGLQLSKELLQQHRRNPAILDLMAAAEARTGNYQQALQFSRRARDYATTIEHRRAISTRLNLYEKKLPFLLNQDSQLFLGFP